MSRRRRKKQFEVKPWMIATGVGGLILLGSLSLPSVRHGIATGGGLIANQVKNDFGVPDADSRALVIRLLDNSGSSRNVKASVLEQLGQIDHIPEVSAYTSVWRYADREEIVYQGLNEDRFVKPALKTYYEGVAAPHTVGTNLGKALEAAEKLIKDWQRANPKSVVVLTIGTDGGVEDPEKARKVAARLAQKNVICFVHGVLVEQRLREQISYILSPLKDAKRLIVSNEKDFSQSCDKFRTAVAKAIKAQGAAQKANDI